MSMDSEDVPSYMDCLLGNSYISFDDKLSGFLSTQSEQQYVLYFNPNDTLEGEITIDEFENSFKITMKIYDAAVHIRQRVSRRSDFEEVLENLSTKIFQPVFWYNSGNSALYGYVTEEDTIYKYEGGRVGGVEKCEDVISSLFSELIDKIGSIDPTYFLDESFADAERQGNVLALLRFNPEIEFRHYSNQFDVLVFEECTVVYFIEEDDYVDRIVLPPVSNEIIISTLRCKKFELLFVNSFMRSELIAHTI